MSTGKNDSNNSKSPQKKLLQIEYLWFFFIFIIDQSNLSNDLLKIFVEMSCSDT